MLGRGFTAEGTLQKQMERTLGRSLKKPQPESQRMGITVSSSRQ